MGLGPETAAGARTKPYPPGFMPETGVLRLASAAMFLNMGKSNMAQGNQASR